MKIIERYISLMVASVAVMFTMVSCSDDDGTSHRDNTISFARPVTQGITRAVPGEISNPYPITEKFRVYGKKYIAPYKGWDDLGNELVYDGAEVTYSDRYNGWIAATKKEWENGKTYSFGAYSPADAAGTITYDATGLKVADFTPAALGSQYDLLYSKRVYGMSSSGMVSGDPSLNTYSGVPITFNHALASIIIKIGVHPAFIKEKADANESIAGLFKIKSITIKGVKNKGTFTQNIQKHEEGNVVSAIEVPKWKLSATPKVAYKMLDKEATPIDIPMMDANKITPSTTLNDAVEPLTNIGGHMAILIPQGLTDITIEIVWTGNGKDYETSVVKLAKYTEWKIGYRYTYTIAFQHDRIYFAPNAGVMGSDGTGGGMVIE